MTTSSSVPPGPAGVPATPDRAPTPGPDRATVTIATYADYEAAQRAIDYLSDNDFPVQWTSIVGTDLRLVERVTGRLTTVRAALAGAASGAWFGLFIGLLFGFFSRSGWLAVMVVAVLIGAAWGAAFGAVAHGMTGGRRDFSSRSTLQAAQYAVTVDAEYANQARQLLTRLNWQSSGAE
jgi:heat induced stress protein YflT